MIFKYLYLCGGTPKIIKILLVVPRIIDGVPIPQVFFPGKALTQKTHLVFFLQCFSLVQFGFQRQVFSELQAVVRGTLLSMRS